MDSRTVVTACLDKRNAIRCLRCGNQSLYRLRKRYGNTHEFGCSTCGYLGNGKRP